MLRELIDITFLEDFLGGVARASGLRTSVYELNGALLGASRRRSAGGRAGDVLRQLPSKMELVDLPPVYDPPAGVAFVEHEGLWTIVVPIQFGGDTVGYVGVGVFRDTESLPAPLTDDKRDFYDKLPVLERFGDAKPVELARWAARILAEWSFNGAQLDASAEQLTLLREIGELLSGEKDLQTMLDRIVAETARVMGLQYCSLRLYDDKTQQLTVKSGFNVLETAGREPLFRRSENPIDDAALRGRVVYVEDATVDTRVRFAQEAKRLGIVSGLATGMIHLGEPIGVLRVYADHKRRFDTRQRSLLRAVAAQAALAVVNARLLEQRLRAATTERQLSLAGEVQARMVRTPPPRHKNIDTALIFEPSSHLSGDFCDIFTLPDRRIAAVVGDVVGHGLPASLLMASARGALRAAARNMNDLVELMTMLNKHIYLETTSSEFVTMLLIALDVEAGQLSYVNAGHEPLLILRDGEVIQSENSDLVLGVDQRERYHEHGLRVASGDLDLLYTDGAVEAMNFEGRQFGRERLHDALIQYGEMPPQQALRNILWDIRRFIGLAERSDDLTMVGLNVL